MTDDSLLIRAMRRQPVHRTPVWMMRQAGRYLPEYRALRQQVPDFMTFCQTPELACEVTLQPLERYDLDAAILFSDILTIADYGLPCGVQFVPEMGPVVSDPIRDMAGVQALSQEPVEEALSYVFEAVRLIHSALSGRVPLIGFAGSPWTVAAYMIEGGRMGPIPMIKRMAYAAPEVLEPMLSWVTQATIRYVLAQIEAGVEAIMLFDTWGGLLSPEMYRAWSLPALTEITQAIKARASHIPVLIYVKGGASIWSDLRGTGCDGMGVDWTASLSAVRQQMGDQVAIQGNLDPAIMMTNASVIDAGVQSVLRDYGEGEGHIFNLGHGIHKETPPDNVHAMIEAVSRHSPAYHRTYVK